MDYLILAMATWRLSNLLVNEDGPGNMFARLRNLAGVQEHFDVQPNTVAGVFACIWCMSIWVGAMFGMLWQAWPNATMWLALPLALSAAVIAMDRVL